MFGGHVGDYEYTKSFHLFKWWLFFAKSLDPEVPYGKFWV